MLKYITSDNINHERWNELIKTAKNSSVFCFDWYLDAFCEWDAIILDDYKGAIALPKKRKWFLNQLFQPPFIQQCNWFGENVDPQELFEMIETKFDRIHFNSNIPFDHSTIPRINLVLKLTNYESIVSSFHKTTKRNIRKSSTIGLEIREDIHFTDKIIELYRDAYGTLNAHLDDHHYKKIYSLIQHKKRSEFFETITVWHNNMLVAGLIFLKSEDRLHYVMGAPTLQGRNLNALSFAFDFVIKKYSNRNYTLDFEGSSIPSVRAFYESFGAKNEGFYETRFIPNPFIRFIESIYKRWIKS